MGSEGLRPDECRIVDASLVAARIRPLAEEREEVRDPLPRVQRVPPYPDGQAAARPYGVSHVQTAWERGFVYLSCVKQETVERLVLQDGNDKNIRNRQIKDSCCLFQDNKRDLTGSTSKR